jgi:hypothetical protein
VTFWGRELKGVWRERRELGMDDLLGIADRRTTFLQDTGSASLAFEWHSWKVGIANLCIGLRWSSLVVWMCAGVAGRFRERNQTWS